MVLEVGWQEVKVFKLIKIPDRGIRLTIKEMHHSVLVDYVERMRCPVGTHANNNPTLADRT